MLKRKIKRWLRDRTQQHRTQQHRTRQQGAGFTLLELLISLFIGSIIVVAMLSLVFEITSNDRKDAARTEVQRDMQLAMNYIAQDLREAVFVYDGRCLGPTAVGSATDPANFCPGLMNHLPDGWNADLNVATDRAVGRFTPLLALWKPEDLPQSVLDRCEAAARDTSGVDSSATLINLINEKGVPCISRRSYTLIVYGLDTRNPSNIWKGRARLSRYRLSQFSESTDLDSANPANPGWVNPKETTTSRFLQWPYIADEDTGAIANAQTTRPGGTPEVLVDFVDNGRPTPRLPAPTAPGCAAPSVPTFPYTDVSAPFPAGAAIPGFFACVRGGTVGAIGDEQTVNQEVQLTLIGNVDGRGGFPLNRPDAQIPTPYNIQGRVFPLQTRVMTRGILDKGSGED